MRQIASNTGVLIKHKIATIGADRPSKKKTTTAWCLSYQITQRNMQNTVASTKCPNFIVPLNLKTEKKRAKNSVITYRSRNEPSFPGRSTRGGWEVRDGRRGARCRGGEGNHSGEGCGGNEARDGERSRPRRRGSTAVDIMDKSSGFCQSNVDWWLLTGSGLWERTKFTGRSACGGENRDGRRGGGEARDGEAWAATAARAAAAAAAGRAETGSPRRGGAGDLTREISHSYVFKFQPAGMLACEIWLGNEKKWGANDGRGGERYEVGVRRTMDERPLKKTSHLTSF